MALLFMDIIPFPWRFDSRMKFDYIDEISSQVAEKDTKELIVCLHGNLPDRKIIDRLVSKLRSRGMKVSIEFLEAP
ncbi:MAG: hypothetical protein QXV22_04585, partial [Thermoplasmataceae archaeon]